jgi:hypothetical protein
MKMSRDVQMSADVTHLVEALSLDALLMLKMQKSLLCLVGTRKPRVAIIFARNKAF